MALISSVGPGGGIDVNTIVVQPPAVEKQQPVESRPSQTESVQANLSSTGKLQNALDTYVDAAQMLSANSTWLNTNTQSSNPSAVSATANEQAQPGDYSVQVSSLAAAQSTASASFASMGTVVGLGTLKIEMGGWDTSQSTFATNPNWPKSNILVDHQDNSLEKVRDKINAAGVGVVASVITDATGSRLVLSASNTGLTNGFKVSAEENPQAPKVEEAVPLSALAFDPSLNKAGGMTMTQAAADAVGKINGVNVQSPSNTVSDAVQGVSFDFKAVTKKPVEVSVGTDDQAIKKSITAFAKAHNELNAAKQAPGGATQELADVGIGTSASGSLNINSVQLDQALAQAPEKVQTAFAVASAPFPKTETATANGSEGGTPFTQKLLEQYRATDQVQ